MSGAGAAALSFTIVKPGSVSGTPANSRIEAGCIGLGNRGKMIAGMLEKHGGYRGGEVINLYPRGAERNIDTFYKCALNGIYENPTVEPSVNATLTTMLGREAAKRNTKLTWDEVIRENKKLEVDLTGLKA